MAQTKITSKSLNVDAVESVNIKDIAVTSNKIAVGAVGLNKLGSDVNNYFNLVNYTLTRSLPLSGGEMSGLISNPTIPAFHFSGPAIPTTFPSEIKTYSTSRINRQNCFNSQTGRFTAPINGLYFFYFHFLNASTNAVDTRIEFYKNSTSMGRQYIITKPANTWNTFYGMSLVELNKNDYVSLFNIQGTLYQDMSNESFGGYLIG